MNKHKLKAIALSLVVSAAMTAGCGGAVGDQVEGLSGATPQEQSDIEVDTTASALYNKQSCHDLCKREGWTCSRATGGGIWGFFGLYANCVCFEPPAGQECKDVWLSQVAEGNKKTF